MKQKSLRSIKISKLDFNENIQNDIDLVELKKFGSFSNKIKRKNSDIDLEIFLKNKSEFTTREKNEVKVEVKDIVKSRNSIIKSEKSEKLSNQFNLENYKEKDKSDNK